MAVCAEEVIPLEVFASRERLSRDMIPNTSAQRRESDDLRVRHYSMMSAY